MHSETPAFTGDDNTAPKALIKRRIRLIAHQGGQGRKMATNILYWTIIAFLSMALGFILFDVADHFFNLL